MKKSMNALARTAAVVGLALIASAAQAQYQLTSLGDHFDVSALNDLGQVVGNDYDQSGTYHPFLWSGGSTVQLGGLGITTASDINNRGQITGALAAVHNGLNTYHAYLYANGRVTDLDPGGKNSSGAGINNNGVVAGFYDCDCDDAFGFDEVSLFANGTIQQLNVPPGLSGRSATAINDAGQVTGSGEDPNGGRVGPFLYSNGTATLIGTFHGYQGSGLGINSSGVVVGYAFEGGYTPHAFVYSGGVVTDLNPTGYQSYANAINDDGQIVGYAGACSDPNPYFCNPDSPFAFLMNGGKLVNLNSLLGPSGAGWTLTNAIDINNRGQILGEGLDPSGNQRAFLLTPVPEPATIALMLAGLGAIGVALRHRLR